MQTIRPKLIPPLDPGFYPAGLALPTFRQSLGHEGIPALIALERSGGECSQFQIMVFPEGHPRFEENYQFVERTVKFLLWQRGGHTLYFGGPTKLAKFLKETYSAHRERKFDQEFMGKLVYEKEFSVVGCEVKDMPAGRETGKILGRNLDGCRIGFDLGASDRKVSAVVDGNPVYSEEVIWEPRKNADPEYHYREIMTALRTAAGKMPRLDAIGGSSAGIYIDNRPMVASLFRSIPPEKFHLIRELFIRIRHEMGVPLEVINDGDVTALAGSMSIGENGILGIALGSSLAAGYVNMEGRIMGWLNELAFAPIDLNPNAPVEEWSGDRGCGASYFSQQCVFRLAPAAGIEIPQAITDAEKLKFVQDKLEAGHPGATKIWQSMGIYLGYAIAQFTEYYDLKHVLILGRCTSGIGGDMLLDGARNVLSQEFPELLDRIELHLPDEKIRRIGQSVAAASLPILPDRLTTGNGGRS